MLRRPSIPSLLRAPSLVDQQPCSRRTSSPAAMRNGAKESVSHPPAFGDGLSCPKTPSVKHPAPRTVKQLGPTSLPEEVDKATNEYALTLATKTFDTASPMSPATQASSLTKQTVGISLSEDRWNNITAHSTIQEPKNKFRLRFWKGKSSAANQESAPTGDTVANEQEKPFVIKRWWQSTCRVWTKAEDWFSYQRFLVKQRRGGSGPTGNGDYDGLESVYSGFTTPTIARVEP